MRRFLTALVLFAITCAVLSNTLKNGFVNFDDPALLYENSQVLNYNFVKAFTSVVAEDYIPMVTTSFALEYKLFGLDPFYFHLGNILLHALCVILIYVFLMRWTEGNEFASVLTALLFAIHPLHVESVAWLAERKDVLSTAFFLLSMMCYWQYLSLTPKRRWYVFALVFFVFALFAKFMAVSLPAVLILFHLRKKTPLANVVWRQIPFALVAGLFTFIHLSLHNRGENLPADEATLIAGLLRGIDSLAFYIYKIFVPLDLSAYYEKGVAVASWPHYAVLVFILLASAIIAQRSRELRRDAFFGWSFFLVTIFPVLQIVTFGNKFSFADRFMYLPSIGLFFWFALTLQKVTSARDGFLRWPVYALLAICSLALSVLTFQRNEVWASSETLWRSEVETYPQSSVAQNNLGSLYVDQGKYDLAIQHLRRSAELKSTYADPRINLGLVMMDLQRLPEARELLEEAVRLDPKSAKAHLNLGVVLEKLGDLERPKQLYERALQLDPDLAIARHNLGVIFYRRHDLKTALETFLETVRRSPAIPETYHNIGVVYVESGRTTEAIEAFQTATRLDVYYLEPHLQLLQIYKKMQNQELTAQEVQAIQQVQERQRAAGGSRPRPRRIH